MRPRPYTLKLRSGEIPERPYMEKHIARKSRPVVNGKVIKIWHKCKCGKQIPRHWKKCDDCSRYTKKQKVERLVKFKNYKQCERCPTRVTKYKRFCEPCRLKHVDELLDNKRKQ